MRPHQIVVDHGADIGITDERQRVDLMRGAEPIEEMHERHPRFERRRLRDQRHVVGFLHRVRRQHGKAGGTHGHDIGMIAENRKRLGRDRTRRHVKDRGGKLAGDLEHVGDHQHQALRGRECRRQRSGLQCSVYGACRAALALHFLNDGDIAPDIGDAARGPLVGQFRHRRGRRNRVDRADLVHAIGDMGNRGVAVHRRLCGLRFSHWWSPPGSSRLHGMGTGRSRSRSRCTCRSRRRNAGRRQA